MLYHARPRHRVGGRAVCRGPCTSKKLSCRDFHRFCRHSPHGAIRVMRRDVILSVVGRKACVSSRLLVIRVSRDCDVSSGCVRYWHVYVKKGSLSSHVREVVESWSPKHLNSLLKFSRWRWRSLNLHGVFCWVYCWSSASRYGRLRRLVRTSVLSGLLVQKWSSSSSMHESQSASVSLGYAASLMVDADILSTKRVNGHASVCTSACAQAVRGHDGTWNQTL